LRIADIQRMIDDDQRARASSDTRDALTVPWLSPAAGPLEPAIKLFQRHVVYGFCNRRRDAVKHAACSDYCRALEHYRENERRERGPRGARLRSVVTWGSFYAHVQR
jgi:hypothetical protein